jgi:hypothetical protein
VGAADIPSDGQYTSVCGSAEMSISAVWMEELLTIDIEAAQAGASLLILAATGNEGELGNGRVPIQGGKLVRIVEP